MTILEGQHKYKTCIILMFFDNLDQTLKQEHYDLSTFVSQAEQIGYYKTNMKLAYPQTVGDRYVPQIIPNISIDKLYFSPTKHVDISLIQRGNWSSSNFMEYLPPDLEEYTYFTVKQYFFIFWLILCLQCVTVIIVKYFTSEQFKKLKWFEKLFHTMECINFAYPYHDWDHEDGDEEQHYQRMLQTKKEVQINLLINTVFNLILLFPLPLSCKIC